MDFDFEVAEYLNRGTAIGLLIGIVLGSILVPVFSNDWEQKYDSCRANLTEARSNASDWYGEYQQCVDNKDYYSGRVDTLQENLNTTIGNLEESKETVETLNDSLNNSEQQVDDLERQLNSTLTINETRRYIIKDYPFSMITNNLYLIIQFPISVSLIGFSGILGIIGRKGVKNEVPRYIIYAIVVIFLARAFWPYAASFL